MLISGLIAPFWMTLALATPPAPTQLEQSPPHVARGDEVERIYRDYTSTLAQVHKLLQSGLKVDAPDLFRKFNPTPPKPTPYGYQILPKLTKDPPSSERRDTPRATSTSYSWGRIIAFIQSELPRVEEMKEQLQAARSVDKKDRRIVYERAVREYPQLEDTQQLVDIHIQYNRFWQKAIHEDRTRFDKLTRLHDAVLERQAVLDQLNGKTDLDARKHDELVAKERALAQMIHEQNQNVRPATFIRVARPTPRVWHLHVPVYTDIQDQRFLKQMREAIERIWRVEDREDTFRVKLDLRVVSPAKLYGKSKPPAKGSHLNAAEHVARFPTDGGVITTGVNSTYAIPARYVALGPQPISHNVMAHEFGHILGFVDGYFRGYRNLGNEGFEVLEIVPDPDDIMCTPGLGHVRRHHFEKLIKVLKDASQKPAPTASQKPAQK